MQNTETGQPVLCEQAACFFSMPLALRAQPLPKQFCQSGEAAPPGRLASVCAWDAQSEPDLHDASFRFLGAFYNVFSFSWCFLQRLFVFLAPKQTLGCDAFVFDRNARMHVRPTLTALGRARTRARTPICARARARARARVRTHAHALMHAHAGARTESLSLSDSARCVLCCAERFDSLSSFYCRGARAAIICEFAPLRLPSHEIRRFVHRLRSEVRKRIALSSALKRIARVSAPSTSSSLPRA
eukprot:6194660-Pleurochrysis_carterae.AAC.7